MIRRDIRIIKKYYNLANFISLATMYVEGGSIGKNLNNIKLKKYSVGHWGAVPNINFIYSSLNYVAFKNNLNIVTIIGAGHAGNAYLANNYLSQFTETYPLNYKEINKLIEQFGSSTGYRSEINASYPYTFYDGGELGYSLPIAYGIALKNDVLVIPIIGDGEAETGSISSSWQLNQIIKSKGKILPIINLNGYKMGSQSLLSKMSNKDLKKHFNSLGYKVFIVNNNHLQFTKILNKLLSKTNYDKNSIIILKTPKGMTGLCNNYINIENNLCSHKNPLLKIKANNIKKEIVIDWLKKYNICQQNVNNKLYVPKKNKINKFFYNQIKFKKYPDYSFKNEYSNNLSCCVDYFETIIKLDKNFVIFSPDELGSNKLGELLKYRENIFELLNENVCLTALIGHIRGGNNGIFISYEGFASIVLSIISQYKKFIYETKKGYHSLNLLLTSLWEENCYSHQNPEILNNLLIDENKYCNVFFPIDYYSLILTLKNVNKIYNFINVIVITKHELIELSKKKASKLITNKYLIFQNYVNPDIILVATGIYQLKECLSVCKESNYKIKLIYIYDISILKEKHNLFDECKNIIYVFHGYPSALKQLLYKYNNNIKVLGFNDLSNKSVDSANKMKMNGCSKENIVELINELL